MFLTVSRDQVVRILASKFGDPGLKSLPDDRLMTEIFRVFPQSLQ
jgi:hypothetical protein